MSSVSRHLVRPRYGFNAYIVHLVVRQTYLLGKKPHQMQKIEIRLHATRACDNVGMLAARTHVGAVLHKMCNQAKESKQVKANNETGRMHLNH